MSRPVASFVAQTPTEFSEIVLNVQISLPVFCVIGLQEAADAVLAAIGSDQDLVLDHGRSHRFTISEFGIGDIGIPNHVAGLRIKRAINLESSVAT